MFNFAPLKNKTLEHSTDQKILFTAEKLFAEKGFYATSTRDIAKSAGVNVSMISYYFGSKEKLFEEIFKVRMKEGDEIILWPGRIINFSERSEGAVFSWDSLPNEWAEIEISESSYFVAGESSGSSGSSGGVASEFRKSVVPLLRYYDPITYVETFTKEKILSVNDKRIYAIIENLNPDPIIIGSSENIDNSISSLIRQSTSIKIMPFSKLKIEITGELYAIRDSSYYGSSGQDYDHNIYITEFLA